MLMQVTSREVGAPTAKFHRVHSLESLMLHDLPNVTEISTEAAGLITRSSLDLRPQTSSVGGGGSGRLAASAEDIMSSESDL